MAVSITGENMSICTVSRHPEQELASRSVLVHSPILPPPGGPVPLKVKAGNGPPNEVKGLPEIYNEWLDEAGEDDFLLFVHDDVFIHDWFLFNRLRDAFEHFDVVGLAGNASPDLSQPSWALRFSDDLAGEGWQDMSTMSGAVGHGDPSRPNVTVYGPTPRPCELLDGLFLAVNVRSVREAGVAFDEQFTFHCYDMDFCRSASAAGLRIGTWPIAVTHSSGGNYDSGAWRAAARAYLDKWA